MSLTDPVYFPYGIEIGSGGQFIDGSDTGVLTEAAIDTINQLLVYESGIALQVIVNAGRATIGGTVKAFAGATISSLTNNDITYVWLQVDTGTLTAHSAVDGTGWPAGTSHVKLAEVTVVNGEITAILDRRSENLYQVGFGDAAYLTSGVASGNLLKLSGANTIPNTIVIPHGQISGLGTAAVLDVGTTANKIIQLDSGGNFPILIPSTSVSGLGSAAVYNALPSSTTGGGGGFVPLVGNFGKLNTSFINQDQLTSLPVQSWTDRLMTYVGNGTTSKTIAVGKGVKAIKWLPQAEDADGVEITALNKYTPAVQATCTATFEGGGGIEDGDSITLNTTDGPVTFTFVLGAPFANQIHIYQSDAVAATATLAFTNQPADGDTFTIRAQSGGAKSYRFVNDYFSDPGGPVQIIIGADLDETVINTSDRINDSYGGVFVAETITHGVVITQFAEGFDGNRTNSRYSPGNNFSITDFTGGDDGGVQAPETTIADFVNALADKGFTYSVDGVIVTITQKASLVGTDGNIVNAKVGSGFAVTNFASGADASFVDGDTVDNTGAVLSSAIDWSNVESAGTIEIVTADASINTNAKTYYILLIH